MLSGIYAYFSDFLLLSNVFMLSVIMVSAIYSECRDLFIAKLNAVMLSAIKLSVVMMSGIMLSVIELQQQPTLMRAYYATVTSYDYKLFINLATVFPESAIQKKKMFYFAKL
jgi:hypothetical protein